ncbi:MAG: hypothetical protein HZB56_12180 [Deltaproteobacteria bacterium]|nr:hypothetical protein [Deltaproteobacteria bacterium]
MFGLLAAALAAVMLVRYAPRALLFLRPGLIRVEGEEGAPPPSPARLRAGAEWEALGFARLGRKQERSPLGGNVHEACSYASGDGVFADLFDGPDRRVAAQLLTLFPDGAAVVTASYPRQGTATGALLVGGLPGAGPEELLLVHRRGVDRLREAHGAPLTGERLELRLALARRWYGGPGAAEVRRLALSSFLSATLALLLFLSSLRIIWKVWT